jgi:hypothetical protein
MERWVFQDMKKAAKAKYATERRLPKRAKPTF